MQMVTHISNEFIILPFEKLHQHVVRFIGYSNSVALNVWNETRRLNSIWQSDNFHFRLNEMQRKIPNCGKIQMSKNKNDEFQ